MTVGNAVALRLDELLVEKHMSLYRLAKNSGVPVSTIQNLYRGHTKSPTLSVLLKLTDALGVSVETFLDSPLFAPDILELD